MEMQQENAQNEVQVQKEKFEDFEGKSIHDKDNNREKEKQKKNREGDVSGEVKGETDLAIVSICMFIPNIRVKGRTTPEGGGGVEKCIFLKEYLFE